MGSPKPSIVDESTKLVNSLVPWPFPLHTASDQKLEAGTAWE